MFLTLCHLRPDTCFGVETRDACSAGATAFSQCALRTEFHFQLAGKKLPFKFLILADIRGNHLLHLPRAEQLAEAFIVNSGIVGGDSEALDPMLLDRIDQPFGYPAQAKTADTEMHVIE